MMSVKAFAFIGILISLVIIGFLFAAAYNSYFSNKNSCQNEDILSKEAGVDTSNYSSVINSTQKKVDIINDRLKEQQRKIDEL